jgi:hypothetical protein
MPPMFETTKMKKITVWVTRVRSRLVISSGRISSIEAPVVPTNEASRAPIARKVVFTTGVASRSPRSRIPPEITYRPASSTMKET